MKRQQWNQHPHPDGPELRRQYAWGLIRAHLSRGTPSRDGILQELPGLGLTQYELRCLLAEAAARSDGEAATVRERYGRLLDELSARRLI